jgi:hypothetical protein
MNQWSKQIVSGINALLDQQNPYNFSTYNTTGSTLTITFQFSGYCEANHPEAGSRRLGLSIQVLISIQGKAFRISINPTVSGMPDNGRELDLSETEFVLTPKPRWPEEEHLKEHRTGVTKSGIVRHSEIHSCHYQIGYQLPGDSK